MIKRALNIIILLVCFVFVGCHPDKDQFTGETENNGAVDDSRPVASATNVRQLILLNINDNHGEIRGLEKVAAYTQSLQAEGTLVLLVHGGDMFSGNGYVDQYKQNSTLQRGFPMIDLMNRMGLVVYNMGNHDFDYGQTTLQERRAQSRFPMLCANVTVGGGSALQPFQATYSLDTLGLKIAFVGTIERNPSTKNSNKTGLSFADPLQTFLQYANLTATHQIVIAMSHQGSDLDKTLLQEWNKPYPDVLISSHDHRAVNAVENGIRYVEAACDLQYVGKIVFDLDATGRIKGQCTYQNVSISGLSAVDNTIKAKVDEYENNAEMNRVIGTLDKALSGKEQVGNLMTDALRLAPIAGCEVAAINTAGVRENSIPAGNIVANYIFKADPFGNQMVTYTMSKTQLVNYVKNNYSRMYWSGIKVSKSGSTITAVYDAQGNEFSSGNHTFGLNDYWTVSNNNYISKTIGTSTTAEILVNYIETKGTLHAADYATGRINK